MSRQIHRRRTGPIAGNGSLPQNLSRRENRALVGLDGQAIPLFFGGQTWLDLVGSMPLPQNNSHASNHIPGKHPQNSRAHLPANPNALACRRTARFGAGTASPIALKASVASTKVATPLFFQWIRQWAGPLCGGRFPFSRQVAFFGGSGGLFPDADGARVWNHS